MTRRISKSWSDEYSDTCPVLTTGPSVPIRVTVPFSVPFVAPDGDATSVDAAAQPMRTPNVTMA